MECMKVKNLLIDYADGMLESSLKHDIDDHLKECEGCLRELRQIEQLYVDMAAEEDEIPSVKLRDDFYSMLSEEQIKASAAEHTAPAMGHNRRVVRLAMRYAALFIVLIGLGFLAGRYTASGGVNTQTLASLQQEVSQLRSNITVAKLSRPSASQRIQAVYMIGQKQQPRQDMIQALIHTLNNDDNINVRLATAHALASYKEYDYARDALIHSIYKQQDPIMQITMIQILVQLKDERAVRPLKQIIENQRNPDMVKQHAKEGLKVYL